MNELSKRRDDYLVVRDLKVHFPVTRGILKRTVGHVKAVDGVSFTIPQGETLGIVGESGSGKSTVGNGILRATPYAEGEIIFDGINYKDLNKTEMRKLRKRIQVVMQDPYSSLDPRMNIRDCISEGIHIHKTMTKKEADAKADELLDLVGIRTSFGDRYPHEFSGGQRQRICIARALAMEPDFIICDEVVSALDVSIQAQVVTLLMEMQRMFGLTYIFIGHDLSVVRYISNTVAVMYLGKFMELTESETLYEKPLHPYTKALISAAPIPNPRVDRARERILLTGEIPNPIAPPAGCKFCTRCPYASDRCQQEDPEFREVTAGHWVACHKLGEGGVWHG